MIKGMDISTLEEVENLGGKFYEDRVEKDALEILQHNGADYARLRLWNDPYDEKGNPYGAGTNDLNRTIRLARRSRAMGLKVLLDFHYSDFWTDPGKQFKPKAWENYDTDALEAVMYEYTREVLLRMEQEKAFPDMIQVGNELSNGLLWPQGQVPAYDNIARFVNAGIRGVRSVSSTVSVMIHLDNGGNNKLYREWFDHFIKKGEDFEIIGLSYYPFWHGSLEDLRSNMNDIALRYGKELIIAEVSMGFSMEDYGRYEGLLEEKRKGFATKEKLISQVPFPMTPQGQADFMQALMEVITQVPGDLGKGFFYWEPAWIPVKGSGWATEASLKYIKDPGPCGNEWANQALFDYGGNALPALKTIKNYP